MWIPFEHWGATVDEIAATMPGDDLIDRPPMAATRAIDIAAAPDQVFGWLTQMGFGRAGWYSYDLIDNLGRRSARRIHPEWQVQQAGDAVPGGPVDFVAAVVDAPHTFVLALLDQRLAGHRIDFTLAYRLTAVPGSTTSAGSPTPARPQPSTRLVSRATARIDGPLGRMVVPALCLGDGVMVRRQLLGIRARLRVEPDELIPTTRARRAGRTREQADRCGCGPPPRVGNRDGDTTTDSEGDREPHPGDDDRRSSARPAPPPRRHRSGHRRPPMTLVDHAADWPDDIDLAPDGAPLAMGTRALGDRPWLVADDQRGVELACKAELCAARHGEVFAALPDTHAAGATVEAMVRAALTDAGVDTTSDGAAPDTAELHPLDRAGRITQEDLCLLRRGDDGWHLVAGSVCFPSRWRLADKIGRHITAVHGPVDGYADRLAGRVDAMFDRLGERPVWRRNWFVHPDPALFQPTRPAGGDPIVPAERVFTDLMIRSERQTLRRLPDPVATGSPATAVTIAATDSAVDAAGADSTMANRDGWILFTIRVQQITLAQFCEPAERRRAFAHWSRATDPAIRRQRGLGDDQAVEVWRALDDR